MKCARCGMESEFDAAFIKHRKAFAKQPKTFCPTCWVSLNNRKGLRALLAIPVLVLVGYLLESLAGGALAGLGGFLVNFALIQLFLVLTIVPHELGHALTARALGWRVSQITIGVGKQIWKRRWKGTLIDLRLVPLAGATLLVPTETACLRLKLFLTIVAGPLINAAMASAVILGFGGSLVPLELATLPRGALLFVMANAVVLLINLWPHQSKTMSIPTDGKQLLRLVSFRKRALEEVRAMRFSHEAQLCRERGDLTGARAWCDKGLALHPEDFRLLTLSGVSHMDAQEYQAARTVFLKLLQQEKQPASFRLILMNNIAYTNALSGQPELLPEADAYSKDACTMLPWLPAVIGTRGTVLVALGQYEEGIRLLQTSLQDADSARHKSENACQLAIAHANIGRLGEAESYLQLARQLDPKCPLLGRAEQCLQACAGKPPAPLPPARV